MNNLNVFHSMFIKSFNPRYWIRNIHNFFKCLKYCKQRITKGYCDTDLWNLDWYYSNVLEHSLKELSERCQGYPGRGEFEGEEGYQKWKDRLLEISNHFHEYNRDIENHYDECFTKIEPDESSDDWQKKIGIKFDDELWDKYLELEKENYNYKLSELHKGLNLLPDIWNDLWD